MVVINTLGLWALIEMLWSDLPPMGLDVNRAYCQMWQEARLRCVQTCRGDIVYGMDPDGPKILCEKRSTCPAHTLWIIDRDELALMSRILLGRL